MSGCETSEDVRLDEHLQETHLRFPHYLLFSGY